MPARSNPKDVMLEAKLKPGVMVRLANRRVAVYPTESSGVIIICKRLGMQGTDEPRVVASNLVLSDEAAYALYVCLERVLRAD